MADNGVREVHGGTMAAGAQDEPALVMERDDAVWIKQGGVIRFKLAAHNARWLARKLNRLALRIEKRLEKQPGASLAAVKEAVK